MCNSSEIVAFAYSKIRSKIKTSGTWGKGGGGFVKIKRVLPILFNASNSEVEWRLNIERVTIDSYKKN